MTAKIMTPYGPIHLGVHAAIDWLLVLAGAAGPFALGYADEFWPTAYTFAVTFIGLGLNAATDYPGGLVRVMPMRWHQFIEWTSPGPFILAPWLLFPDATGMKWLLTGIGAAIVLNTALTRKGSRPYENTSSGSSSLP